MKRTPLQRGTSELKRTPLKRGIMNQQEIIDIQDELHLVKNFYDRVAPGYIAARAMKALDRLTILEAAVAWHGFDELPENKTLWPIELLRKGDLLYRAKWHCGKFCIETDVNKYTVQELIFMDFTGWRYPVGDLSE